MTTARKNALWAVLGIVSIPLLSFVFATGAASRELSSKESRESHASDLRAMRDSVHMAVDSVKEERRIRELQRVRDSSQMATVLERITDFSCDQNPRRAYCRH